MVSYAADVGSLRYDGSHSFLPDMCDMKLIAVGIENQAKTFCCGLLTSPLKTLALLIASGFTKQGYVEESISL